MSGDITIYRCAKCRKEFGFIEHFSHDHPDFLNDKPAYEYRLCPECKKFGASGDEDPAKL